MVFGSMILDGERQAFLHDDVIFLLDCCLTS